MSPSPHVDSRGHRLQVGDPVDHVGKWRACESRPGWIVSLDRDPYGQYVATVRYPDRSERTEPDWHWLRLTPITA